MWVESVSQACQPHMIFQSTTSQLISQTVNNNQLIRPGMATRS